MIEPLRPLLPICPPTEAATEGAATEGVVAPSMELRRIPTITPVAGSCHLLWITGLVFVDYGVLLVDILAVRWRMHTPCCSMTYLMFIS